MTDFKEYFDSMRLDKIKQKGLIAYFILYLYNQNEVLNYKDPF